MRPTGSRRGRLRSLFVVAFALAGAQVAASGSATAAATESRFGLTCVPRPVPLAAGRLTHITKATEGRLVTYTMTSPAVGLTHVDVLLPAGYDGRSARRYPVLYLLHGAGGSYANWASTASLDGVPQGGDAAAIVGKLPLIVVMPDDSGDGSYTDWYGIST
ncbi:MAG TPA: hypothetical protein VGP46_06455, partial [Acidimicrobiales bacterium]|nr:hypothetical protein [Acidimicrobiales bacterium]